ncbi:MAG TPA: hypothetical protein VH599_05460 [Ktedonobacterales bacterium]|jgi:hypothetical protein
MAQDTSLVLLVGEKLAAFERLQPEFEASFQYVQEVQGQRRFSAFSVADSVRYLHALWVCERKDRLLSIPRTAERYEGRRCLELLRDWQAGETAGVVDFLQHRLDTLPFGDITRQLEIIQQQESASPLAKRLAHGRLVLLNRGMNLLRALEPLFTLSRKALLEEAQAACAHYGHRPDQITEQLAALDTTISMYVPHPALAQRNMRIMDRLGVRLSGDTADQPGRRSWQVAKSALPASPFAEQIIGGYVDMTSARHNNLTDYRFFYQSAPLVGAANAGK